MSGRLGHIVKNDYNRIANNGIKPLNYAYNFPGASFWLDANYGTSTKTDAASVNSWTDKIANLTFSAGSAPLYRTAPTGYNSNPTVDFNTSARYLTCPLHTGVRLPKYFAVAFVANIASYNTNSNTLIGRADNNADKIILAGASGLFPANTGISFGYINTVKLSSTVRDLLVHISVVTESFIVVDGAVSVTGSVNVYGTLWDQIGSTQTASSVGLIGQIAEILVYNRQFSQAEAIQLCDNLNTKYAIY